jgi:erythritol kinase (D-erythritol 1-phosphate-forming)
MEAVWSAVVRVTRETAADTPEPVELLATTAQGDGLWLIDSGARSLGRAMLWNDARAASIVEEWDRAGVIDWMYQRSGSVAHPGMAHALLTWLSRVHSMRCETAKYAMTCNSWLGLRLTGEVGLDASEACNPWFNIATGEYDYDLLERLGLDWASPLLPPVRDDGDRVRPLTRVAAEELGLEVNLPVVTAPYDVVAAALGMGATEVGEVCSILGTTLCTEVVLEKPRILQRPSGSHLCLTGSRTSSGDIRVSSRWLQAFATLSGTDLMDWTCKLMGLGSASDLSALASSANLKDRGPILLPYFSPGGERAPFRDSRARGEWWGLDLDSDRSAMARSVFEGLSFALRECFEVANSLADELFVCGGGSESSFWCQMIADSTGAKVVCTTDRQSPAKGALVAAHVALGHEEDVEAAAARLVRNGAVFHPDPQNREYYEGRYQLAQKLRDEGRARTWAVLEAAASDIRPWH